MNRRQQTLLDKLSTCSKLGAQLELLEELVVIEEVERKVILEATQWQDYHLRHLLRLINKLVPEVRYLISQDKINFSLARAIASLPQMKQEDAARSAIAKHTSVHKFRHALSSNKNQKLIKQLNRLSDQYSAQSGLDIEIIADKTSDNSGRWIIRYFDLEMFDTIRDRLNLIDE
jgi:hypothetical protein